MIAPAGLGHAWLNNHPIRPSRTRRARGDRGLDRSLANVPLKSSTARNLLAGLVVISVPSVALVGCSGQSANQPADAISQPISAPVAAQLLGPADDSSALTVQLHLAQQVAGVDLAQLVELAASDAGSRPLNADEVATKTGATSAVGDAVVSYFAKLGLTASIDPTRTFANVKLTVPQASKLLSTSFGGYREASKACRPGGASGGAKKAGSGQKPTTGKLPSATAAPITPAVSSHCEFLALMPAATVTIPGELATNLQPGSVDAQIGGLNTRHIFTDVSRSRTAQSGMFDAQNPNGPQWWKRSGTGTPCPQAAGDTGFMVSQLRTVYGFPASAPTNGPFQKQNVVMVGLAGEDGASQQMLTAFANCVGIAAANQPKLTLVPHDGSTPTTKGSEANGDAQTLAGFGAPAIDTIYEVDDAVGTTGPGFLQTLADATTFNDPVTKTPVDVISISYASCESEITTGFGFSLDMGEQVLAKAALANKTIVAASGDSGSSACVANGIGPTDVAVNYPASSQWVTGVGGTRLYLDQNNQIQDTRVWNDSYLYSRSPIPGTPPQVDGGSPGAGGGGVSTAIDRPSWQTGTGVDMTAKRQVPDVSYFADSYPGAITNYLGWGTFDGTSMAAPMFAAAVAQYNARHPSAHLGFANPKLYAAINAGKLKPHDITAGTNIIGGLDAGGNYVPNPARSCCTATVGFDTASGWGSVDVQSMIDGLGTGGS